MTVIEYAKSRGISSSVVYYKIKKKKINYRIDKDGCVDIDANEPWVKGRPGRRVDNGRMV